IRGMRIEPGEIESQLLTYKGINQAIVIHIENPEKKNSYLCAYFTADKKAEIQTPELRAYLNTMLPDYMIPFFFVQIEQVPLNPNGKLNRRALPVPTQVETADYEAPRDEVEEKLVQIWAEILEIEKSLIGTNDNFFEIGGHSLKAAILLSRIHRELHVKITLAQVFSRPTIRGMGEYIRSMGADDYSPIKPAAKKEYYPLTPSQERLYFLQQLVGENIVYNMPAAFTLEGTIDKNRLHDAFNKLIQRHESFRTSFEMIENEPVQRIHKHVEFKIAYFDLATEGTEGKENKIHYSSFIIHHLSPFVLSCAPLLKVCLASASEIRHLLFVDMHHIISDGVSQGILIRDFIRLYEGEELLPLKLHYKDYAEWLNSEREQDAVKQHKEFWLNEFAGEIPLLDIPRDFSRPVVQSFAGAALTFRVESKVADALKTLALGEGVTHFMIMLSLYTIFLARLSGREDIVVGTPIAGRKHADLEKIIGMFVNTLPLRNFPLGNIYFNEFLKDIKQRTLVAFTHQDYPYDELVEALTIARDTGRNPLFDTMLAVQNMELPAAEVPGLTLTPFDFQNKIAKFDLTL
ncbi:MAG TPA: condensation domain-containing protein, partial [Candidatus Deferrimicrobium sp.]|nr:condensation domain-containing protein [Candidatus Deferrimicrobium sp.]